MSATAAIDQIINSSASQVQKVIKQNTMDTETKTTTSQLIDGFMSGSTFTKIVWIVVVGGIVSAIIAAIVKLMEKP